MTQIIKQNKWFAITALILMLSQLFLDTLNVANFNTNTTVWIGAIGMFISIVNAGFKQYFSDIDNSTIYIQVLLFVAYIAGGVLDQLDILPFNDDWKSIIRLGLTFISSSVPMVLKFLKDYDTFRD